MGGITLKLPTFEVDLDARELAGDLAQGLGDYWAEQLDAGRRSDGRGSLPRNAKGEPMGRGKGTISDKWETSKAKGSKVRAVAMTAPYQDGGHFFAVRSLRNRGIDLVSLEGEADAMIDAILAEHADKAIT